MIANTSAEEEGGDNGVSGAAIAVGVSSGCAAFFLLLGVLLIIWLCRRSRQPPAQDRQDPEGADNEAEYYYSTPSTSKTAVYTPAVLLNQCYQSHNRSKDDGMDTIDGTPLQSTGHHRHLPQHDAKAGTYESDAEERKMSNPEEVSSKYWQPGDTLEKLYSQFESKRFRSLKPPMVEINENDVIGSGEFGMVKKGVRKKSDGNIPVAIKVVKANCSSEDRIRFLREAAIMGQFKHENIVYLHGAVIEGDPLMIVMELMSNGDLKHHLQSLRKNPVQNIAMALLKMSKEIASGMDYLAGMSFVHRDLAARNVLLDGNVTCKIGDFGLSRDLFSRDYYITKGGRFPVRWTAPEAINKGKYSTASDVWSYGIVLYEIWTLGERPYGTHWPNNYVLQRVASGYRLPPPPGCCLQIYKLMMDSWNPDHHKRPTFKAILNLLNKADLIAEYEEVLPGYVLGGPLDSAVSVYKDLQTVYQTNKS